MNEAQENMLLTMFRNRPEILNKEQREYAHSLEVRRNSNASLTALQTCLDGNGLKNIEGQQQ